MAEEWRPIESALSVRDFKRDDRVKHSLCGPGTVTFVDDAGVHVTFDKIGAGGNWRGVYNDTWFRIASATLTLLPAPPEKEEG